MDGRVREGYMYMYVYMEGKKREREGGGGGEKGWKERGGGKDVGIGESFQGLTLSDCQKKTPLLWVWHQEH